MRRACACAALALASACAAAPRSEGTHAGGAAPREAALRAEAVLPFHVAVAPPASAGGDAQARALAAELDGRVFARATAGRDAGADLVLEWSPGEGVRASLRELPGRRVLLEASAPTEDPRALADELAALAPAALFPPDDALRLDWQALSIAEARAPASLDGAGAARRVTVAGAVVIPSTARLARLRSVSIADPDPKAGAVNELASGPPAGAAAVGEIGPAEWLADGARRFAFRLEGVPAAPFLRLELVGGSRELVRRRFTLRVPESRTGAP